MRDKRVKDKRIALSSEGFLATVEFFRDTPERDGDYPLEKNFATLKAAQVWLAGFPRDVWDGYSIDSFYKEIDDVEFRKTTKRHSQSTRA